MTETTYKQLNAIYFRNGFGIDIENVGSKPLWTWFEGQNPMEDEASIGVFEGFVINIPFFKIFLGKLYY